jgi:hypothetical protein
MLNNIIGAVALYSWDGENTDIVRFNQQFYESVDVPDFMEKLTNIERVMPPEDVPVLHSLFKEAKEHRLSGSSGMVRFVRRKPSTMCWSCIIPSMNLIAPSSD